MSSASEPPILELSGVSFAYPGGGAVRDLGIAIRSGDFIGLLGANGSGKSTVLKLCSGILRPSGGKITLWGRPLHQYRNRDRAKLLSYLPQTLDMAVPFTVRELVNMGLYPYDIPPLITGDEALAMAGLIGKADSPVTDLSGGEKRRTFIAMTLLQGAGLLFLDEPLANLDVRYQIDLIRLLRRLQKERNISVVMALHDIGLALQFDTVMLLKDGRILGSGRPGEILTDGMLEESFGLQIALRKFSDGGVYVRYAGDGESLPPAGETAVTPSLRFFQNRDCRYFPCHGIDPVQFNCIFCFCPLYFTLCPGTPAYTEIKGLISKDCSGCTFPHQPENYEAVLSALREASSWKRGDEEE